MNNTFVTACLRSMSTSNFLSAFRPMLPVKSTGMKRIGRVRGWLSTMLLAMPLIVSCSTQTAILQTGARVNSDNSSHPPTQTIADNAPKALYGICFSPYRTSESPDCGALPSEDEIREELEFIKNSQFACRLRTYSCLGTLGVIPAISNSLGLECWPGAWLSKYPGPTERELRALIAVGKKKLANCPVLIVGNEVLLRNDMSEQELIAAVRRVKMETGAQVGYAGIGDEWMRHPEVAKAVDVIIVHLYPYWESRPINGAVNSLIAQWQTLVRLYPGKRVVIGETGWPSAGEVMGAAIPSIENQAMYFREFLHASRVHNIEYFYFSLFSEVWKIKQEGRRGGNWGLFSADGKLNPLLADLVSPAARNGMRRVPRTIHTAMRLSLPAFIYREGDSDENRYYPTNWMGDVDDLAINEYCAFRSRSGTQCLQVQYKIRGNNRWAGIYWVGPYMNHWGSYPGYFVHGAKKIVFWARGERGGEKVEFKTGGMNSPGEPYRDSFGPLPSGQTTTTLDSEWHQYSIDLQGANTSSVLGGFCFVVNETGNPNGCTFYLDDVVMVGEQVPPPLETRSISTLGTGDINAVPAAIMAAQRNNVRESWGEDADQCYTVADYTAFCSSRTAGKIAAELLSTREIQAAILTLRNMSATELELTARQWRRPLRKTWAQLGRISREGQTDAGQRAENDIANAIVDAILQACRDPRWQPTTSK